jgi:hypothetical protein
VSAEHLHHVLGLDYYRQMVALAARLDSDRDARLLAKVLDEKRAGDDGVLSATSVAGPVTAVGLGTTPA